MKSVPIVEHHHVDPSYDELRSVDRLAAAIQRERPKLALEAEFRELVPNVLHEGPALHLDDLTGIPHLEAGRDIRFYQERARLRAGDGDLVATSAPEIGGYENYCREALGLGSVDWLRPRPLRNPLKIAEACWGDATVRDLLIRRLRSGDLAYVHPQMGTFSAWQLAALLQEEARSPLKVIAPPPGVTKWVNDKLAFSDVVVRLFGKRFVPRTSSAWNLATLTLRVADLAAGASTIGIKLPNSGGGDGTLVMDARSLRGHSLRALRGRLKHLIGVLDWRGQCELLIGSWETEIVCSPSAQMWIPLESEGLPIVEGLFVQVTEGPTGVFVGHLPAQLPSALAEELATRCWLLGRLFQRLGYLGRCSFDMILVGPSLDECRVEFVECNGRWGGTSTPMTLMTRLIGDWSEQPYVNLVCQVDGLRELDFVDLLECLGHELFDRRDGTGRIILATPGRALARSAIDVIALGKTTDEATAVAKDVFVERVRQRVASGKRSVSPLGR